MGVLCLSLLCYALLCDLSSFAIILKFLVNCFTDDCFLCFVALRPKSTANVIAVRSAHLWASLNKRLTSNMYTNSFVTDSNPS